MTQQLHVAGLPRVTEDGYFDAANANKSWVRVHGGQSSEFPIYPTTRERTIIHTFSVPLSPASSTGDNGNKVKVANWGCFFRYEFTTRE